MPVATGRSRQNGHKSSAQENPIKVAVIGTGTIGARHAQLVSENPDTTLCGVVDPDPRGLKIAQELGTSYYTSVSDLLASSDCPSAAIVCTPNHRHVDISKQLAERGIHLLVEKPISVDAKSGQDLIDFAKQCGVSLLIGHHRRFIPNFAAAKEAFKSLGDVTLINGLWTSQKEDDYFEGTGIWRQGDHGGPVLINLIHEIDILQYLLGPITHVTAEKVVPRRGYKAEEGGALIFRFESGTVGSFAFCDNVPSPFNVDQALGEAPYPYSGMDVYRIFGTKATLSLPDMRRWSYDRSEPKNRLGPLTEDKIYVQTGPSALESQLAHFVEVIRYKVQPSCSGSDGLQALIVAEAVKKAMESGTTVQLDRIVLHS